MVLVGEEQKKKWAKYVSCRRRLKFKSCPNFSDSCSCNNLLSSLSPPPIIDSLMVQWFYSLGERWGGSLRTVKVCLPKLLQRDLGFPGKISSFTTHISSSLSSSIFPLDKSPKGATIWKLLAAHDNNRTNSGDMQICSVTISLATKTFHTSVERGLQFS